MLFKIVFSLSAADLLLYNGTIDIQNNKFALGSPENKELNILLMGETGVGKSTWINGFANYLTFATLKEAEANDWISLIPTKFTMMTDDYEQKLISFGLADENEKHGEGQSATQGPRTYRFSYDDITVRLIDTPGVGDTRGTEQDKENFNNILTHIARYDKLNGICILLKPNNARLDITFEYCIKELLKNLHRDASRNIVFCFTNARSTFFMPGETMVPLKTLLAKSDAEIETTHEYMYCFDNEAVRYLAAVKSGVTFGEDEQKTYVGSWDCSVKETEKLIEHFAVLEPHLVKDMLSINNARHMVLGLIQPLALITSSIQKNLSNINDKKSEPQKSGKNMIAQTKVKLVALKAAQLVCKTSKCMHEIAEGNVTKTEYRCKTATKNLYLHKKLKSTPCKQCKCLLGDHEVILYDDITQKELIEKEAVLKNTKELKAEQKQILTSSAQFAYFLKSNAIALYNDKMTTYLEYYKRKCTAQDQLDRMDKICREYEDEVKNLEEAINAENGLWMAPSPDDVQKLIDGLYAMKHFGQTIREGVMITEAAESDAVQESEIVVEPKRKPDLKPNILQKMKSTKQYLHQKKTNRKKN